VVDNTLVRAVMLAFSRQWHAAIGGEEVRK
jgi:hypothetical protein